MLELPWLPEAPHAVFERPPLMLALCQVRFAAVLGVSDPAFVAPFQRSIQNQYPVALPAMAGRVEIEIGPGAAAPEVRAGPQSQQWRFSDQQDDWTTVLAQDFVAVETRVYDTFADFLGRLRQVLEAVVEHIQPSLATRVGLRYVNEIRTGHEDWSSVVRRELLGPLAVPELQRDVRQAVQQILLRSPDAEGATITHGILPNSTTVQPRQGVAPPAEPFYLLDFDIFREYYPPQALPMDPDMICEQVETFNKTIYRLFRWSVTDEYISALGVRSHAAH